MKRLFVFNVLKEQEIEETELTKNEKGEEVKIVKKIKKNVPQTFLLKKPSRTLIDEADLFYGIRFSEAIKLGLLTRAQLSTKLTNDGGTISEAEKQAYVSNYTQLFEKENEFQKVASKKDDEKTEEDKANQKKVIEEITELRLKIQEVELSQNSVYDYTAEVYARNRVLIWWLFHIAHDSKEKPLFAKTTHEENLKYYDDLDDETDAFLLKVIRKFLYLIGFWYIGKANTLAEFEDVSKFGNINEVEDAPKTESKVELKPEPEKTS